MTGNLQFKRGLKNNLPTSAPSGMPLWCTDTKELYIGTDIGLSKIGSNNGNSSSSESTQKFVNILPISGKIKLEDNSINTIVVNGDVIFELPEIEDNKIFHEILVQVSMPNLFSLTLGTNNYLTSETPDMSQVGVYNILFEYHDDTWFVAVVKKNGILGQRYIRIDFGEYNGDFELNINDGEDYYLGDSRITEDCIAYYQKDTKIDYSINCYLDNSNPVTKSGTIILDTNTTIYVPDLLRSNEGIIDDLEDLLG